MVQRDLYSIMCIVNHVETSFNIQLPHGEIPCRQGISPCSLPNLLNSVKTHFKKAMKAIQI